MTWQRYAFLLKKAMIFGKKFEAEDDKKKKGVLYDASLEETYASFFYKPQKKVYPLLPDGNKRVHLNLFYVIRVSCRLTVTTSPPYIFCEDIPTGIISRAESFLHVRQCSCLTHKKDGLPSLVVRPQLLFRRFIQNIKELNKYKFSRIA